MQNTYGGVYIVLRPFHIHSRTTTTIIITLSIFSPFAHPSTRTILSFLKVVLKSLTVMHCIMRDGSKNFFKTLARSIDTLSVATFDDRSTTMGTACVCNYYSDSHIAFVL